jgi:hypothetical protein
MATFRSQASVQTGGVQLSEDERALVCAARRDGFVAAKLYDHGDFSEDGFMLFGRLELLCLKGVMRFVDRIGKNERAPGDVRMIFALAEGCAA